ncbi:RND transporter [Rickettsia hoogstraalii]|nr:RND transporter [Rickettsia hoogstraalii]
MRRKIENFDEAISGYLMRLPRSLWLLAMTI